MHKLCCNPDVDSCLSAASVQIITPTYLYLAVYIHHVATRIHDTSQTYGNQKFNIELENEACACPYICNAAWRTVIKNRKAPKTSSRPTREEKHTHCIARSWYHTSNAFPIAECPARQTPIPFLHTRVSPCQRVVPRTRGSLTAHLRSSLLGGRALLGWRCLFCRRLLLGCRLFCWWRRRVLGHATRLGLAENHWLLLDSWGLRGLASP